MGGRAVVLATRSAGKLRELRAMFESAGIALEDLGSAGLAGEDPAEDGLEVHETFEENARRTTVPSPAAPRAHRDRR